MTSPPPEAPTTDSGLPVGVLLVSVLAAGMVWVYALMNSIVLP